jgi:hypothetical protein
VPGDERRARLVHPDAHRNHLEKDRDSAAHRFEHESGSDRWPHGTDQRERHIYFGNREHLIRHFACRDGREMPRTISSPARSGPEEPSPDYSCHGDDRGRGQEHGGPAGSESIDDRKGRDAGCEQRHQRHAVESKLDGQGAQRGRERQIAPYLRGLRRLADDHAHRHQCVQRFSGEPRAKRRQEVEPIGPLDGQRPGDRAHHIARAGKEQDDDKSPSDPRQAVGDLRDSQNVKRFGKERSGEERHRDRDRACRLHRIASLTSAGASAASSIVNSTCIHHRG